MSRCHNLSAGHLNMERQKQLIDTGLALIHAALSLTARFSQTFVNRFCVCDKPPVPRHRES